MPYDGILRSGISLTIKIIIMSTPKFKNLEAYQFKEPKFNYGFIQANSNFFNRATDFINNEENEINQRAFIARKGLAALEVNDVVILNDNDAIEAFIESLETKSVENELIYE